MREMIVGGNGFLGRYLRKRLTTQKKGELLSVVLNKGPREDADTVACDVSDPKQVDALVEHFFPDRVYFFAGSARVGAGTSNEAYFRQNFLTIARFLEAMGRVGRPFQLFLASSVHVYGNPTEEVTESTPTSPIGYYGYSKCLAEKAVESFSKEHPECQFIVGRLYTCIGPGQGTGFVLPDLCSKIHALKGKEKLGGELVVRSPQAFRQFLDVRDLIEILPRLWNHKERKNLEWINLASPEVNTIQKIAEELVSASSIPAKIKGVSDPNNPFLGIRIRSEKLNTWVPSFPFRPLATTVKDVWLEHIEKHPL